MNTLQQIKRAKHANNMLSVQKLHLAREITRRKNEMKLSGIELAELSGLNKNTITSVLAGNGDLRHSTMYALATVLKCSISDLFQYDAKNDPDGLEKAAIEELRTEQILHDITY